MLNKFLQWFSDWRRGYSDADLISVTKKLKSVEGRLGAVVELSNREMKAYLSQIGIAI